MSKVSEVKLIIIVAGLSQLAMQLVANMATVIIRHNSRHRHNNKRHHNRHIQT